MLGFLALAGVLPPKGLFSFPVFSAMMRTVSTRTEDLAARAELIVLSPHLDDAALSVGGLLHRAARRGARVEVVTMCTAAFEPQRLARLPGWLRPAADLETRKAEDRAALGRLGAEPIWLELPDAACLLSRPTRRALREPGRLAQPAFRARQARLEAALAGLLGARPRAALLVPLGLGGHLDHLALCAAGLLAARGRDPTRLFFYADVYAALAPGDPGSAPGAAGLALCGVPQALEAEDARAKLEAVACYASQLGLLGGAERLAARLEAQHASLGGAEPLWAPGEGPP